MENAYLRWLEDHNRVFASCVLVHSRPPSDQEIARGHADYNAGKAAEGLVPMIFLDPALDTLEMRRWIASRTIRRYLHGEVRGR